MIREMHVWLELPFMTRMTVDVYTTYMSTCKALQKQEPVIHTTLLYFAKLWMAERLFIHIGNECHEITEGECEGTDMWIRRSHSIDRLLLAGVFDWWDGEVEE